MYLDPNYYNDDTEHNMWLDSDRETYEDVEYYEEEEAEEPDYGYLYVPPVESFPTKSPVTNKKKRSMMEKVLIAMYCITALVALIVTIVIFG